MIDMERTQHQIDAEARLREAVRLLTTRREWQEDEIIDLRSEVNATGLISLDRAFEIVVDEYYECTIAAMEELTVSALEDFACRYGFAVETDEDGQLMLYTDLYVNEPNRVATIHE